MVEIFQENEMPAKVPGRSVHVADPSVDPDGIPRITLSSPVQEIKGERKACRSGCIVSRMKEGTVSPAGLFFSAEKTNEMV